MNPTEIALAVRCVFLFGDVLSFELPTQLQKRAEGESWPG